MVALVYVNQLDQCGELPYATCPLMHLLPASPNNTPERVQLQLASDKCNSFLSLQREAITYLL